MPEDEGTNEEGEGPEPAGAESRSTDIEDQGQAIDAAGEADPDVESVEVDESDPGPEGVGASEATQKSGEAPTEIVGEEDDSEDE